MGETPQIQVRQAYSVISRRFKAVIAAKGVSTKNTDVNVIFQFQLFIHLQKMINLFLLCNYGVLCAIHFRIRL
jgi:hypothetical protein